MPAGITGKCTLLDGRVKPASCNTGADSFSTLQRESELRKLFAPGVISAKYVEEMLTRATDHPFIFHYFPIKAKKNDAKCRRSNKWMRTVLTTLPVRSHRAGCATNEIGFGWTNGVSRIAAPTPTGATRPPDEPDLTREPR